LRRLLRCVQSAKTGIMAQLKIVCNSYQAKKHEMTPVF